MIKTDYINIIDVRMLTDDDSFYINSYKTNNNGYYLNGDKRYSHMWKGR